MAVLQTLAVLLAAVTTASGYRVSPKYTAHHLNAVLMSSGSTTSAPVYQQPAVDTRYPYNGPQTPVGDFQPVDTHIKPVFAPAVPYTGGNNSINVIHLSYVPTGMNIHWQTPFGTGAAPAVQWFTSNTSTAVRYNATGNSITYNRTPNCTQHNMLSCSQYFHNVQITGLNGSTTYYYQIVADKSGYGTSPVMSFRTAQTAGDNSTFSVIMLNDMGFSNANGTYRQIRKYMNTSSFVIHGGDLSYADDWQDGLIPCSDWPVCYNNSDIGLPSTEGGPYGGDSSDVYETNWDTWQQWLNPVTSQIPYMTLPGNHEAGCIEFDVPPYEVSAYLNNNTINATDYNGYLNYYSCPVSQRNFTAYTNRFRMPGQESGGYQNMWYSYDAGLIHFVALNTETDFPGTDEKTFIQDAEAISDNATVSDVGRTDTGPTDSGPFGKVGNDTDPMSWGLLQWLDADLAAVNRTKTPWVVITTHRPMYTAGLPSPPFNTADADENWIYYVHNAFAPMLSKHKVDLWVAGHIHWYERLFPMIQNGTVDTSAVINNSTYRSNGISTTFITNGQAGNIEGHALPGSGYNDTFNPTYQAVLNNQDYGMSRLTVVNSTALHWQYIRGSNGTVADEFYLIK